MDYWKMKEGFRTKALEVNKTCRDLMDAVLLPIGVTDSCEEECIYIKLARDMPQRAGVILGLAGSGKTNLVRIICENFAACNSAEDRLVVCSEHMGNVDETLVNIDNLIQVRLALFAKLNTKDMWEYNEYIYRNMLARDCKHVSHQISLINFGMSFGSTAFITTDSLMQQTVVLIDGVGRVCQYVDSDAYKAVYNMCKYSHVTGVYPVLTAQSLEDMGGLRSVPSVKVVLKHTDKAAVGCPDNVCLPTDIGEGLLFYRNSWIHIKVPSSY